MFCAQQIRDALGGLTFSKTPSFNHTSLQESPLSFYDQYGDDRNTTYSADTVKTPAFTTQYARVSKRFCVAPCVHVPPLLTLSSWLTCQLYFFGGTLSL